MNGYFVPPSSGYHLKYVGEEALDRLETALGLLDNFSHVEHVAPEPPTVIIESRETIENPPVLIEKQPELEESQPETQEIIEDIREQKKISNNAQIEAIAEFLCKKAIRGLRRWHFLTKDAKRRREKEHNACFVLAKKCVNETLNAWHQAASIAEIRREKMRRMLEKDMKTVKLKVFQTWQTITRCMIEVRQVEEVIKIRYSKRLLSVTLSRWRQSVLENIAEKERNNRQLIQCTHAVSILTWVLNRLSVRAALASWSEECRVLGSLKEAEQRVGICADKARKQLVFLLWADICWHAKQQKERQRIIEEQERRDKAEEERRIQLRLELEREIKEGEIRRKQQEDVLMLYNVHQKSNPLPIESTVVSTHFNPVPEQKIVPQPISNIFNNSNNNNSINHIIRQNTFNNNHNNNTFNNINSATSMLNRKEVAPPATTFTVASRRSRENIPPVSYFVDGISSMSESNMRFNNTENFISSAHNNSNSFNLSKSNNGMNNHNQLYTHNRENSAQNPIVSNSSLIKNQNQLLEARSFFVPQHSAFNDQTLVNSSSVTPYPTTSIATTTTAKNLAPPPPSTHAVPLILNSINHRPSKATFKRSFSASSIFHSHATESNNNSSIDIDNYNDSNSKTRYDAHHDTLRFNNTASTSKQTDKESIRVTSPSQDGKDTFASPPRLAVGLRASVSETLQHLLGRQPAPDELSALSEETGRTSPAAHAMRSESNFYVSSAKGQHEKGAHLFTPNPTDTTEELDGDSSPIIASAIKLTHSDLSELERIRASLSKSKVGLLKN